jgi:hypothetical protein
MYCDENNNQYIDTGDICLGNSFRLFQRAGKTTTYKSRLFKTLRKNNAIIVRVSCLGELDLDDNMHIQLFSSPSDEMLPSHNNLFFFFNLDIHW